LLNASGGQFREHTWANGAAYIASDAATYRDADAVKNGPEVSDPGSIASKGNALLQKVREFWKAAHSDILSVAAVAISTLAVYVSIWQVREAQAITSDRLYFCSYRIGQRLEDTINVVVLKREKLTDADLKDRLKRYVTPIEHSLGLESALGSLGVTDLYAGYLQPNSPESLYHDAAVAKYDNRNVNDAFEIGQGVSELTFLLDNYTSYQPAQRNEEWTRTAQTIDNDLIDSGFVKAGLWALAAEVEHTLFNTSVPCDILSPQPPSSKIAGAKALGDLTLCLSQQWGVSGPLK
jgi:hypothetical protein